MSSYAEFLERKRALATPTGILEPGDVHPMLHNWQADIVRWACKTGRAAIFADCGLGKTFMQLEWARLVADRTLIVAPLSVARQTEREAAKLGIPYSTIAGVCNGTRGIGRDLAARMHRADQTLDASVLLWVRPIKRAA